MKRVKVHATLGPASRSERVIRELILAGADGFRVNFSHASHEEGLETIKTVRRVSSELGKPVSIRQDLAGPKIRVGTIKNDQACLEEGKIFILTGDTVLGDENRATITYSELASDISPGQRILLADGSLELRAEEIKGSDVVCRVVTGGVLKSRKGVNLPRAKLNVSFLTPKDIKDMEFGIAHGVDFITLSFVKKAEEVLRVKQMINERGADTPVITKIETAEGVENFDEILSATDGISIARGDLGVEWEFEELPLITKILLNKCSRCKKFAMIGAQAMMSMINSPSPSRADVTDIVNSVLDGADVINFSDETAVGNYPVEVVKTVSRIIEKVESVVTRPGDHPYTDFYSRNQSYLSSFSRNLLPGLGDVDYAIMPVERWEEAECIRKNTTGMLIFACTASETLANRLATYRGLVPILVTGKGNKDTILGQGLEKVKQLKIPSSRLFILNSVG